MLNNYIVDENRPILIIDSGMGGVICERRFDKVYPSENKVILIDNQFMPYGTKDSQKVVRRVSRLIDIIKEIKPKAILIACNTIEALALDVFEANMPNTPVVGMIDNTSRKAISFSKKKPIVVLATENTINSQAYLYSISLMQANSQVIGVECPNLASAIENNKNVKEVFKEEISILKNENFSTIILGCTHYAKINPLIKKQFPSVTIIDSTEELMVSFQEHTHKIQFRAPHLLGETKIILTEDKDMSYVNKLYGEKVNIETVIVKGKK